jgi:hypothetical protein
MTEASTGGFECGGSGFRFHTASCRLVANGLLFLQAVGSRCGLRLVGVPFPGAVLCAELPGRSWEPDEDELAVHADVFAEGGLEVRGKHLWIMGGRVACTRFDPDSNILTVSFRLSVQDGEHGAADEADGVAHCQVQ